VTFSRVYVDGSGTILNPNVRDDIREALSRAKGQYLDITIEPHKDQRSAKANNYYWGVVLALMAEHTGHTADDLHDAMCARFLPSEQKRIDFFNQLTGECLEVPVDPRRSSKLKGEPFYQFVEMVREFARDFLQVETPDPDPEYWRKPARRAA